METGEKKQKRVTEGGKNVPDKCFRTVSSAANLSGSYARRFATQTSPEKC